MSQSSAGTSAPVGLWSAALLLSLLLAGAAVMPARAAATPDSVASIPTGSLQLTRAAMVVSAAPRWAAAALSVAVPASGQPLPKAVSAPPTFRVGLDDTRPSALELLGEVRGLRKGVGFDWGLPPVGGNAHLNLYAGKDGFGGGRRWRIGSVADANAGTGLSSRRLWSLGASVDVVRFRRESLQQIPAARVAFAPQLMLDLDALTGLPGNCDLMVQHTIWRSVDNRASDDEKMLQLNLRWKF